MSNRVLPFSTVSPFTPALPHSSLRPSYSLPDREITTDHKPTVEERQKASMQTPAQYHTSEQKLMPYTNTKPAQKHKQHKQEQNKPSAQSQPPDETPRASMNQYQRQYHERTQLLQSGPSQDPELEQTPKPKQTEYDPLVQEFWSIDPASFLHLSVNKRLEPEGVSFDFYPYDDTGSPAKEWHSATPGRFDCVNHNCRARGWPSKAIPILIRLYGQGQYNVRICHQRCDNCNELGQLRLNQGVYIERVVRRLKIWHGLRVEPKPYQKGSKGEHWHARCEGCRNGCCPLMRQTTYARSGGMSQGEGAVGGPRTPSTWVGIF